MGIRKKEKEMLGKQIEKANETGWDCTEPITM